MRRTVQVIWWIAVFLVLILTTIAGAVSLTAGGERPSAVALLLALAGAVWAVGRRLMDIVTIERLSD